MIRLPKIITTMFNASNLHLIRNGNKIPANGFLRCNITYGLNHSTDSEANEGKTRRKTPRISKITLLHPDNSMTILTLEEALKVAKKKKLHLVQVLTVDPKNDRSVYKLVDPIKYLEGQANNEETNQCYEKEHRRKATKLFTLKSKISEHDLKIKINNINKVLKKGHKVKICLTHPDGGQESVLQFINKNIEGTVSSEKVHKDSTIVTYSALEDHLNNAEKPQNEEVV